MATITARLTLTGTGATSDMLGIDKSKSLTVTNPTVQVGTTALTTTYAATISDLNGTTNAEDTYVYLYNASVGSETIHVQTVATTTGTCAECVLAQSPLIKLAKAEFAMIPLEALAKLQFKGSLATAILEYGYWTKGS